MEFISKKPNREYSYGIVAGTFSKLHKGHKHLLKWAFLMADRVLVCITTDEYVRKLEKNHPVESYYVRLTTLAKFLEEMGVLERAIFYPLNDMYGPALTNSEVEVLFVSEETFLRALQVNRARVKRGLRGLDIFVVPLVLAEDGLPISSTRVWRGEIDPEGRLLQKTSIERE